MARPRTSELCTSMDSRSDSSQVMAGHQIEDESGCKKLANTRNDFVSRWHLSLRTPLSLVFDLGYLGDLIIPWLFHGNGPGLQRKHTLPTGTDLLQDKWVDTRVFLDSQTQVSTLPTLHPWKTCNKATQPTMPAEGEYPSQMNASST